MYRLGFIGLGRMGMPMASRLVAAGHQVSVFARRPDSAAPILNAGATLCPSPRAVAERSDVVFTMVTDTAAVEDVVFGDQGVAGGAAPGLTLIDHSTIAPAGSRRIAERLRDRGVDMLDAPVSGGIAGATAGTLSIMVGGDSQIFERCRPLLEHIGRTVTYVGGAGAGQIAKACNQICIVVNQLGVAEAVLLARASGVDFTRIQPALLGGFAASRILEVQGPKMAAQTYDGEIESRLHAKDIKVALEWAHSLGVTLPASGLAAAVLDELQESGGARLDSAAVFAMLERRCRQP
jgi:3-hydroxyisobutyrate dehydrogenase-like beta-hydroxyacid dehydrogenase